jgi:putative aldouronate transport system permease protein
VVAGDSRVDNPAVLEHPEVCLVSHTSDIVVATSLKVPAPARRGSFRRYRVVYLIMLPALIVMFVYRILPLWGYVFAVIDYNPFLGVFRSPWVGLRNFERLFGYQDLRLLLRNTFVISGMRLLIGFPVPILLALFLNDTRNAALKRTMQSLIYLPHFISWPVVVAITVTVLAPGGGLVNEVIKALGGTEISFLIRPNWFRPLLVLQGIWKEAGWGTVVYLAALANIDPNLYEAASIEGCNKLQRTWYITLPAAKGVAITLFILGLGRMVNENFQQIFLMMNPLTQAKGEVFETYNFTMGIIFGEFSYATAVGLFKSIVAFIMITVANWLIRRAGERGLY